MQRIVCIDKHTQQQFGPSSGMSFSSFDCQLQPPPTVATCIDAEPYTKLCSDVWQLTESIAKPCTSSNVAPAIDDEQPTIQTLLDHLLSMFDENDSRVFPDLQLTVSLELH